MQKRLLILFILFGLATAYSLMSLLQTNDASYISYNQNNADTATQIRAKTKPVDINKVSPLQEPSPLSRPQSTKQVQELNKKELPFLLKLVGISEQSPINDQNENNDIYVLIQFQSQLFEHKQYDFIGDSNLQLININKQSIDIMYDDALYKIQLTLPNLLSDSYKKPEETYSELIKMEADDIGTRPRIIEHLVTLTYTPFIADGQLVSPGLNPALFAQAGFKGDDVLKTINGKSVTVASELEEIQRELKMASTLEFVVMRRGKLVTLFLDIPSESLELTVD